MQIPCYNKSYAESLHFNNTDLPQKRTRRDTANLIFPTERVLSHLS